MRSDVRIADRDRAVTGIHRNAFDRKMIENAVEVVLFPRPQLDPGHGQEARFLASGRAPLFPAIRFSR